MRWLYHVLPAETSLGDEYAPESLTREGFIHASFRNAAAESARLYFASDRALRVLQIDPRRLTAPVRVVDTPRGAMPHIHGAVPRVAIVAVLALTQLEGAPDHIS